MADIIDLSKLRKKREENDSTRSCSGKIVSNQVLIERRLEKADFIRRQENAHFENRAQAVKALTLAIKRRSLSEKQAKLVYKKIVDGFMLTVEEMEVLPHFQLLNSHVPIIEEYCGSDQAMYHLIAGLQNGLFERNDASRLVRLIKIFYNL